MRTVAVVGVGLIGRSWAFLFARAGFTVRVFDREAAVLDRLPADIAAMVAEMRLTGCAGSEPERLAGRIRGCATLADALEGAELVQESGPEIVDVKRAIFAQLDRLAAPGSVIASSSSGLVASQYTEGLPGCARCLVAHPVNPPHLVPVVELSPGPGTDPAALDRAEAIYREAGQVPVRLAREIDGFVLNRLQAVLLAESLRLVAEGIVTAEGLDDTVRHGLGRRWAFMGPLETIALNAPGGIEDYLRRYGPTMARLADDAARGEAFEPARIAAIGSVAEPGAVRARQEWRDGELAALDRHLTDRRERSASNEEGSHGHAA